MSHPTLRAGTGPPVRLAMLSRTVLQPQTAHLTNGQPSLEEPGRGDTGLSHPPHPSSSLPPHSCDSSAHGLVQPSGAVPTPPPSPGSQAALRHPTRPTFLWTQNSLPALRSRGHCKLFPKGTRPKRHLPQPPEASGLLLSPPSPRGHQEAQSIVGFSPQEWLVTQSPLCPYPRPPASCLSRPPPGAHREGNFQM